MRSCSKQVKPVIAGLPISLLFSLSALLLARVLSRDLEYEKVEEKKEHPNKGCRQGNAVSTVVKSKAVTVEIFS